MKSNQLFPRVVLCSLLLATNLSAQTNDAAVPSPTHRVPLWPGKAPVGEGETEDSDLELEVFLPSADRANGTAIVLCPGGGYIRHVTDREGYPVARWLNQNGIATIILEYRLPGLRPERPLLDVQRAIRLTRAHAEEWRIDPRRIGVLGFSAGGHVASSAATHFDVGMPGVADPAERLSSRPDFAWLVYPVITMGKFTNPGSRNNLIGVNPGPEMIRRYSNEKHVTRDTPPTFLAHAIDDEPVPPENSRQFAAALKANGVPVELLELPSGGHGLNGCRGPLWELWKTAALKWLAGRRIIPTSHPVPENPQWLTYPGGKGPGMGKHIVLIAADQEYRSEQAMPMMAGILSIHHGFHCTVLFGVNEDGLVDPTMPVYPKRGKEKEFKSHDIPGLEHLKAADLVIFFPRLLTLPMKQKQRIVEYLDSGKPIISLRTGNHGFRGPLPYRIKGKQVRFGELLGGSFRGHYGNWHRDSTRGDIVEAMKDHPILRGVKDIWGPSDVYRTFKEEDGFPKENMALVMGQPLIGREYGGADNPKKIPLPVAWFKYWTTSSGEKARVFQSTMGSARDLQSADLRRLIINAVYWGLGVEDAIKADSSVDYAGEYKPLASGFNYEKLGVFPQPPAAYRQ